MNDSGWRRNKYGGLFNINDYMNQKIRGNNFDQNFRIEDGDYYKEFNEPNYDYENNEKDWNKEKKGYDQKETGLVRKRISVIDKKTNEEVAYLKYKEVYDFNKTILKNKINVDGIVVNEKYRRKGIGTYLYKELQKRAGNTDIYFGEFSPEGKKLVEKIGVITKIEKHGSDTHYHGRIK